MLLFTQITNNNLRVRNEQASVTTVSERWHVIISFCQQSLSSNPHAWRLSRIIRQLRQLRRRCTTQLYFDICSLPELPLTHERMVEVTQATSHHRTSMCLSSLLCFAEVHQLPHYSVTQNGGTHSGAKHRRSLASDQGKSSFH